MKERRKKALLEKNFCVNMPILAYTCLYLPITKGNEVGLKRTNWQNHGAAES